MVKTSVASGLQTLSDDLLIEVTGYRHRLAQQKQLRKMQIPFLVGAGGRPVVLLLAVEQTLGGVIAHKRNTKPRNFQRWRDWFDGFGWGLSDADADKTMRQLCEEAGAIAIEDLLDGENSEVALIVTGDDAFVEILSNSDLLARFKVAFLPAMLNYDYDAKTFRLEEKRAVLEKALGLINKAISLNDEDEVSRLFEKVDYPRSELVTELPSDE